MKRKADRDSIFFLIMILFSFCFSDLITTNFLFLISIEEIQATVRKSSVFLALPALIMPLSFALSKQFKRAVIVFFVNMLVVICGVLIARSTFENGFDYAVYSAFSAVACLVFVLEYIIPKQESLKFRRFVFSYSLLSECFL